MFYGHIGIALASKPAAPKASLGVLLIAATLIDTLSGLFTALGIENTDADGFSSIPWSHGLVMSIIWSGIAFGISYAISHNLRTGIVIGMLVFSHWLLDFISHPAGLGKSMPPDLPLLFIGSAKEGLGLYGSLIAAIATEIGMLIAGVMVYLKSTHVNNHTGKCAFACLLAFLAVFPMLMFLPARLFYLATFATLLLLPLGIWVDRNRSFIPWD